MPTVASSKARRSEGTLRVKGFHIAYVLWVPFNANNIGYETVNLSIDPLSMTNHFEETVICFHGWLDNANSFATLAPLLASKFNMRVIGIDLPGHGKSTHSLLGYYDASLYTTTMMRIINRLHLRAVHLMGHSLSAIFLPYITPILEHSGKFIIKSLICIEQFGAMRTVCNIKAFKIDSILPVPAMDDALDQFDDKEEDIVGDIKHLPKLYNSISELVRSRIFVTEQIYPGKQTIDKKSAKLILERNVGKLIVVESNTRKKQIKYYLRTDPKLRKGSRNTLKNVFIYDVKQMSNKVIKKTKCPILAVFGDAGWPQLDRVAEYVKTLAMPNLKIIRMKGSHHLHADDPQTFLDTISPFLTNAIEKYKNKYPNLCGNGNVHSKL